jgi:HEAT repeat protein
MPFFYQYPKIDQLHKAKDLHGLVVEVRSHDREISEAAVGALDDLGELSRQDFVIESLIDLLKTGANTSAYITLGKIGGAQAADAMLSLLGPGSKCRRYAIWILGQMKDMRAFETLMFLLSDKNHDVHAKAAEALGELGDVRAVATLISLKSDRQCRQSIVSALIGLDNKQAADALFEVAMHDKNEDIRNIASLGLRKRRDERATECMFKVKVTELIRRYKNERNLVNFTRIEERYWVDAFFHGQVMRLGLELNELGGLEMMQKALGDFKKTSKLPAHFAEDIRLRWDGIGDW